MKNRNSVTSLPAAVLVAILIAAAVAGGRVSAQIGQAGTPTVTGPALKEGWWIRINPGSQATHLYWRFGTSADRLSAPVSWVQGQGSDTFDLPAAQRGGSRIHIAALGMPPASPVSFCLFLRDRGVALVEFTREKNIDVDEAHTAAECVP